MVPMQSKQTTEERVVTTKHFYFDEDNGCRNFFYQIIGGYFDKEKKEFHNVVHP